MLLPVAYTIYFQLHRAVIRHQMEEALESRQLHTLGIPLAQVFWVKPGKEIRIGDRFFDIKESYQKHDTLWVQGLFDEEEKSLHATLHQIMNHGANAPGKINTLAFLGWPWKAPATFTTLFSQNSTQQFFPFDATLCMVHLTIPGRPPASAMSAIII